MVSDVEGDGERLPRGALRSRRTQLALLDAAERLLGRTVSPDVRVEEIANEAQVSVGSVYVHFGSKNSVIAAVAARIFDRAVARLDAAVADLESPVDRLDATGAAYARLLAESPIVARYVNNASFASQLGDYNEVLRAQINRLRDRVTGYVRDARDQGLIRPVDPELMADFLFGAWNGVAALEHQRQFRHLTAEQVVRCLDQAREAITLGLTRLE